MKKLNYKTISQIPEINSKEFVEDGINSQQIISKKLSQNTNRQLLDTNQAWQNTQTDHNINQNTQEEDDYSFLIQSQRKKNEQFNTEAKEEKKQFCGFRTASRKSIKSHSLSIKSSQKEEPDLQNDENQQQIHQYQPQTPNINNDDNKMNDNQSNNTNQNDKQSRQFLHRNGTLQIFALNKDDRDSISPSEKGLQPQNQITSDSKKQSLVKSTTKQYTRNGKSFFNSPSIKYNKHVSKVFASNINPSFTNFGDVQEILQSQQASSKKWNFINSFFKLIKVKNKFLDLINQRPIKVSERSFVMDQSDGIYSAHKKQIQQKSLFNKIFIYTFHPASPVTISVKAVMLFVTIYNLFFVPLIVGFQIDMASDIVLLQQISGIAYLFEIFLNFRIAIYVKGEIQTDLRVIAKDYVNFNFLLDAISVIGCALGTLNTYFTLFTLVRITNVFTYTNYINNHFYFAERFYKTWTLTRLIIFIIFMAHIFACIFHYIGLHHLDSLSFKSWLHQYQIESEQWQIRYNYSLYYSFITMITIGYGDIAPQNSHERIACIVFALSSSIIFSFSINTIGNIFQDYFSKFQYQLQIRYNAIKFLGSRSIDKNLQLRILKYIEYIHEIDRESPEKGLQIMNQVSEELKTQVFQEYYGKILQQNKHFSLNYSKSTILKLSLKVKEKMFAPGEILFEQGDQDERLYYIIKGECEFYLKSKEGSKNFFHKALFQQTNQQFFGYKGFISGIPREFSCRSLNVSHVFYIQREDLIKILKQDPQDYEQFCRIKDQFLFYTNSLGELCFACKNFGHTLTQCNRIHYVKNRSLLIQKYNYCEQQKRNPHQRKSNKFKTLQEIDNVNFSVLSYKKNIIIDIIKEEINGQIVEQYVQFLQKEPVDKVMTYLPYLVFQEEGIVLKHQSDDSVNSQTNNTQTESDSSQSDIEEDNTKKQTMNSIEETLEDNLSQSAQSNKNVKIQLKSDQKSNKDKSSYKQYAQQALKEFENNSKQNLKSELIDNLQHEEEDNNQQITNDDLADNSNQDFNENILINKSIDSINKEINLQKQEKLIAEQKQTEFKDEILEQDQKNFDEIIDDLNFEQNELVLLSPNTNVNIDQNDPLNNKEEISITSSSNSLHDQLRIQNYYKQFQNKENESIISPLENKQQKLNNQQTDFINNNFFKNKQKNQSNKLEEGTDLNQNYFQKKNDQNLKFKSSLKNTAPSFGNSTRSQSKKLDQDQYKTMDKQSFNSKFSLTKAAIDLNYKEKRFSQIPVCRSIFGSIKESGFSQKTNSSLDSVTQQYNIQPLQKLRKQSIQPSIYTRQYQNREQDNSVQKSFKKIISYAELPDINPDSDKINKDFSKSQDKSQKYFLLQKFSHQLLDLYILDFETLKEYKNYFPHNNASVVCKSLKKQNINNVVTQKKLITKELQRAQTKYQGKISLEIPQ